jgi:hypothetical protein
VPGQRLARARAALDRGKAPRIDEGQVQQRNTRVFAARATRQRAVSSEREGIMKGCAALLFIATVTGCDILPPGPPGADAGLLDAGRLDASTDAGDSGSPRDGGTPRVLDGGGASDDVLDAAVAVDAAVDAGDDPLGDSGAPRDGGAPSAACDAPGWILARCGVHEPGRRAVGRRLPPTLSSAQRSCVEHWLAIRER